VSPRLSQTRAVKLNQLFPGRGARPARVSHRSPSVSPLPLSPSRADRSSRTDARGGGDSSRSGGAENTLLHASTRGETRAESSSPRKREAARAANPNLRRRAEAGGEVGRRAARNPLYRNNRPLGGLGLPRNERFVSHEGRRPTTDT
jgi:hypothetical protein